MKELAREGEGEKEREIEGLREINGQRWSVDEEATSGESDQAALSSNEEERERMKED